MKTILFWDNVLSLRGTSVALYDYALYNEEYLGNKSIIGSFSNEKHDGLGKFQNRFETHLFDNINNINNINHDFFFVEKYGHKDNILSNIGKNLIHAVFPSNDPHGDVYAYISKWLSDSCSGGTLPYVPYMIDLPNHNFNYKEFLNISKEKLVIGWYGGDNFHIPFAQQAVIDAASKREDIIFLFMNQTPFCSLENIIFIEGTSDLNEKVAFINTCDAMIHARERGETFGLAIGEFSTKNKPIITYGNSPERNHIEILGDKGIYYHDYNSLYNILINIQKLDIKEKEWNCYQDFTPKKIMKIFKQVFNI